MDVDKQPTNKKSDRMLSKNLYQIQFVKLHLVSCDLNYKYLGTCPLFDAFISTWDVVVTTTTTWNETHFQNLRYLWRKVLKLA